MPEHRLVVLCEPPSHLGLGSPFCFIHFSSLGEDLGAAGISRASRTFDLSGGCVPFGHWVTSLLVTCAVDNCHFLWFPYYFQKFQDFDLGFEAFPTGTEKARQVTKTLLKDVVPRYGMPLTIGSDNGLAFVADTE